MSSPGLRRWERHILAAEYQKRQCRKNYLSYVEYVHGGRWIPGKMHVYICNAVQEFLEKDTGRPYDILIINVPPQHGKSMAVTETLPSWYLGKNPQKHVIEISYGDDFAQLFGRRNKEKIKAYGKEIFDIALSKNASSNIEFELSNNVGSMISRGVMAGITGRACNLMIIDDPIKNRAEADSETYRQRLFDEWQNSYKTRLAVGAKVILIQTRWHESDLAGKIKETEQYEEIVLPCEAEEQDPLGRIPGQALCPEIGKDDEWLKQMKTSYQEGARAWNALFQCRPTSQEGNILKREWWRFYDADNTPKMAVEVLSVDCTFKDGSNSDYVTVSAWGKRGPDIYLLHMSKKRLDFTQTIKEVLKVKKDYPTAVATLIEGKANGSGVISVLRKQIGGIIEIEPKGGKITRVNAISPYVESGNVYLPRNLPFTDDFVEECAAFPNGKHDDQVDGMSQALLYLIFSKGRFGKGEEPVDFFQALFTKTENPTGYRTKERAEREV